MNIMDIVDFVDEKKSKLNSAEYLELMRLLSILNGSALDKKVKLVDSDEEEGVETTYNSDYIDEYI